MPKNETKTQSPAAVLLSNTALRALLGVATNEKLSKKVRKEAYDGIVRTFADAGVALPSVIEVDLAERLKTASPTGGSRAESVIGKRVKELLMEADDEGYRRYTHKEIAAIVCRENPGATTSAKSVASTLRDWEDKAKVPPIKQKGTSKERPADLEIDLEGILAGGEDGSDE
jgi:hypothetical protein